MHLAKRTSALAAVVGIAAAATGCTSGAVEPSAATPSGAPSSSATPTPVTTEQAAPGIQAEELPDGYYVVDGGNAAVLGRSGEGCEGLPGLEPRSNESPEGIGGYWYSELRDLGPIDHATGAVTVGEDGQPAAYVAAEGDTMYGIARRFCIDYPGYLGQLNGIRRGDGSADLFTLPQDLYPGDTINLDPYTIATVGDQQGLVFDRAIDYRIPEQR